MTSSVIKRILGVVLMSTLLFFLLFLLTTIPSQAQVATVDNFEDADQYIGLGPPQNYGWDSTSESAPLGDVLGEERDLSLSRLSGSASLNCQADYGTGLLLYSEGNNTTSGRMTVSWDGIDGSDVLSPTGLGSSDLTAGGADRFVLTVASADWPGYDITATVYSSATNWSYYTWLNQPAISSNTDLTATFTSFSTGGGSGADFTNVGAVVLEVEGIANNPQDLGIEFFGTDGPTAITLSSFTAEWDGDQVTVVWETAMEIDTVGFNVWRSTSVDGGYVKVNSSLIPAESLGGVLGGSYSFTDAGVTPGATYYYKLEELEVGGVSNWYGPTSTGDGGPTAAMLSVADTAVAWWPAVAGVAAGAGLTAFVMLRRRRQHL